MVNFQIGQCHICVDTERTELFYSVQPKVTDLCSCSLCSHYQHNVIHKPVRIYKILTAMGVDLTRFDKEDIEGVWHIGERDKFENSYLAHYKVFGHIGKTQNKRTNDKGLFVVHFFENEDDSLTKYSFTQLTDDSIEVRIEIECDRK